MAIVRLLTLPEGAPVELLTLVGKEANVYDEPPEGLIAHAGYVKDGRVHVTDFWDSREQAEKFDADRLRPAIERVFANRGTGTDQTGAVVPEYIEAHDLVRGR